MDDDAIIVDTSCGFVIDEVALCDEIEACNLWGQARILNPEPPQNALSFKAMIYRNRN